MPGNQQERCQLWSTAGGNLTGFDLCGGWGGGNCSLEGPGHLRVQQAGEEGGKRGGGHQAWESRWLPSFDSFTITSPERANFWDKIATSLFIIANTKRCFKGDDYAV